MIIIENHYLGEVIKKTQFDTFYHEHPRTYSLKSFVNISKKINLNLIDFKFVKRYNGNIRVFLNAAPAKKINDELFNLVDILLVNEIESQQLLDTKSTDFKRLAEELSNYVSRIIITLGDKGVVYFEKNKKVDHINAHSVDVKSALGAGDYFAGKFISNFIVTNDFEDSIKTANKKTSEFISS